MEPLPAKKYVERDREQLTERGGKNLRDIDPFGPEIQEYTQIPRHKTINSPFCLS